ncbi:MAG: DNA translocase FtsK 4TM domain-containing protein [Candidatus Babeliales bacterium]|nr:DNA translocase FtsK 4TM domain-containing protein [Candidatus Babeliales bacterium]
MKKIIKLINNKFFQKNKMISLLIGIIASIIFISLFSYNYQDLSFFYYNSSQLQISNWLGFFGANTAAILFYLFGFSAFVIVFFLIYLTKMFWNNVSLKKEWEVVLGFIILILNLSILFSVYNISFFNINSGIVGKSLHIVLNSFFKEENILLIFLFSMLWVSLILINRFSIIPLLRPLVGFLGKFENKLFSAAKSFVFQFCAYLKSYIINFVNLFYITKDDSQKLLLEDEYLLSAQDINLDDEFWNNYKNKPIRHASLVSHDQDFINESLEKSPVDNELAELPKKYTLPDLSWFNIVDTSKESSVIKELEKQAVILEDKLKHFGVHGKITAIAPGPVITLFEYKPNVDTKISKIIALEDDLSMALQANSIRIIAPIPGKSVVGFEVSNKIRKNVFFANMIQSDSFKNFKGSLPLILGEDTFGNIIVSDLVKMPHLLVAGSTGSGKSVSLNAIISGLLCKCSPSDLKMILIDPKRLEFAQYTDIAHLLFPIVTNPKFASPVLRWAIQEMEARYEQMAKVGVKNIFEYNDFCVKNNQEKKPFIVIIIDELADLMMTAGKEIEDLIIRIAQMARASGIHMIVATQRPSVDVITGLIKINFPCRIAFRVASKVDSRIILDNMGADKLLGKGDMLLLDSDSPYVKRVHGAFISAEEILKIVDHIRLQTAVNYLDLSQVNVNTQQQVDEEDGLYKDILNFLDEIDEVSISLLQRKFRIGYNRSARIIETLESQGYIFPMDGGKTRKVIKNNKI